MLNFLGEYDCRLDDKGRIKMPASLIKQFPTDAQDKFVLNRGFEQHLILYPKSEWLIITEEINKLNAYERKVREFKRFFYRGATELSTDSSSRLLLPKSLLEWAKIDKDVILFAHTNIIEIWSKDLYDNLLSNEPQDFAELAEIVMGSKSNNGSGS
jgi:MraZ protein